MSRQLHQTFVQIRCQPIAGHIPNANRTIIRSGRNHVVIEWIPFQIENLSRMTDHFATLKVNASGLRMLGEILIFFFFIDKSRPQIQYLTNWEHNKHCIGNDCN